MKRRLEPGGNHETGNFAIYDDVDPLLVFSYCMNVDSSVDVSGMPVASNLREIQVKMHFRNAGSVIHTRIFCLLVCFLKPQKLKY
jgi:hypothetical protein